MSEHGDFPGSVTGLWEPERERRPGPPEHSQSGIGSFDEDPPELPDQVSAQLAGELLKRSKPRWVDLGGSGNTTAAGLAGFVLYTVAAGLELTLGWLLVSDDTHTFGSPYSAGTDWIGVYRNGAAESVNDFEMLLDGGPASAGGPILPLKFEWGSPAAPKLVGPCSLVLRVVGDVGIGSKRIQATGQGQLARREGFE